MTTPGDVGLCGTCRHARVQATKRGSRFWRCQRAETDARFARYPALPVRACPGHELGDPAAETPGGAGRESLGGHMIQLWESESGKAIGSITEAQLEFLIDQLQEESATDQEYYLDVATLDFFDEQGADPALVKLLRAALGEREGMDVRWSREG